MSQTKVTLYKPDGAEIVFLDVRHTFIDDSGALVIQPSDAEEKVYGEKVRTTLPFLIHKDALG